jgi:hypothetical protein
MICRSCGAEIADKAIVCYRCGTPTADVAVRPPAPRGRSRWVVLPVLIVVLILGAWLIPMTPPSSPARIAAWVVTSIVVLGAVAWAQRRASS